MKAQSSPCLRKNDIDSYLLGMTNFHGSHYVQHKFFFFLCTAGIHKLFMFCKKGDEAFSLKTFDTCDRLGKPAIWDFL